jgi:uncharacterized protein (TIGR03118 family)
MHRYGSVTFSAIYGLRDRKMKYPHCGRILYWGRSAPLLVGAEALVVAAMGTQSTRRYSMLTNSNRSATAARRGARLFIEALECRRLLSGNVLQTNLVSDLPGVAAVQDPHLVNPWGIAESSGSPFWISDNNAGVSTLYNTAGVPQSLVVSIPSPGDPLGASGTPTGTAFNIGAATGAFKVNGFTKTGGATSAAAVFLFATEDGTIVGWNPGVNPQGFDVNRAGTYGIIAVPPSPDGAVYKGLSIASGNGAPIASTDPNSTFLLYATNFHSGQVEAYDPDFMPATLPTGAFSDSDLPKGYAPFNVQLLGGKVYVTYAKQDKDAHDDVSGPGNGFVDVYNLDGTPGLANGNARLVSRGPLDSPWGLAIAPASFGSLAGDLLVGNFGDGFINAFDPATGQFLGQLNDPDGEPMQIDGLWALKVGNGSNGGDSNKVYFTAGLFDETHGLFGSLTPVAAGTPEGPAEAQMAQAALDVAQINLITLQADIANNVSQSQFQQDRQALQKSVVDLIHVDHDLVKDLLSDGAGGTDTAIDAFLDQLRDLRRDLHL